MGNLCVAKTVEEVQAEKVSHAVDAVIKIDSVKVRRRGHHGR